MKKNIFIAICFLFSFLVVFSQSNPLDRKMEKAFKLAEKEKYDEADKYVEELLEQNPSYGAGWDYLKKIRLKLYSDSKKTRNVLGGNFTITTKDKNGNEIKQENDTLGKSLLELLNKFNPSETAYNKYIYTMRKATLLSNDAYYSSMDLRKKFAEDDYDTMVSKKALKHFYDAEDEFEKKNYNEAAKLYKRAIEVQPDFHKASLYMGDCFYFLGNYKEAVIAFKEAVEKFPRDVEARKFLIDAYGRQGLYDLALEESIKAMTIFPDLSIEFAKMEDAIYASNKTLNIKWVPRGIFPNKINPQNVESDINKYTPTSELIAKGPWTYYKESQNKISSYCNEKGVIVKPNTFTESKYMEVYGWQEMLKNSQDSMLDEARRIQKDGYLDCYALVTCFHIDFYDQYRDFVSKNATRVVEYYKKYISAK